MYYMYAHILLQQKIFFAWIFWGERCQLSQKADRVIPSHTLNLSDLSIDSVEMINPWNFQLSTPYGPKVLEIWKFDQNEVAPE